MFVWGPIRLSGWQPRLCWMWLSISGYSADTGCSPVILEGILLTFLTEITTLFVHMVACQSGHTSNCSKQNNSNEHLDNQTWACMQMWNLCMQPYNWILVLMYAHRYLHGSCMDVYVHIWLPIWNWWVCSLTATVWLTTTPWQPHISASSQLNLSVVTVMCWNLLGDHSSF